MPIGKNLKKDTLIPESSKKVKATKAVKRKKTVKKETSAEVETVAEQIEEQTVQSVEIDTTAQSLELHKITGGKFITEKEYEERERLKEKFDKEIESFQGKELQLVNFPLGKESYAVDIDSIKEVVPTPSISKIPHSPKYIKGVANIRGTIMVVLDLEAKFELDDEVKEKAVSEYIMVIKGRNFLAGILLDQVPVTLKVSGNNIVSSGGLLSNTALDETYIKGLIKTESEMVIYLDISELVEDDDVRVMNKAIDSLK